MNAKASTAAPVAAPTTTKTATVTVTVTLPEALTSFYVDKSIESGQKVGDLVLKTLEASTALVANQRPLYFNDVQRRELEVILGEICKTPEDAINRLRFWFSIKMPDEIGTVVLSPDVIARLKDHAWNVPLGDYTADIILRHLGMN